MDMMCNIFILYIWEFIKKVSSDNMLIDFFIFFSIFVDKWSELWGY